MQHRVWRWHFFAGLLVIPFAMILATTGGIYLFKPQFEAFIEASINARAAPVGDTDLNADEIVAAARNRYPDGKLARITLPRSAADRTFEVEIKTDSGARTIWVARGAGEILHDTATAARLMNFVKNIHGNLLTGNRGSLVVELMASWMIVLIITGVFLWWPRGQSPARFFAPSLRGKPLREKIRSLHGALGAWIGGMVLLLLLSGLPWTQVWGGGFDRVASFMGWDGPGQEWTITLQSGDPHAHHKDDGLNLWTRAAGDEGEVTLQSNAPHGDLAPISLQAIVEKLEPQNLGYPVEVQPPRGENGVWSVRSMTQHRPDRVTIHFDRWTGDEIMRIGFYDRHPVQRVISYGIAMHEGALFGWLNQLFGVVAAIGVLSLSVTGAWMWWRRRPKGSVGVPPMPADRRLAAGVIVLVLGLAAFLPLVTMSLVAVFIAETCWGIIRQRYSRGAPE